MGKKRIYELAKELHIESKDIIKQLEKMGLTDKKPASALEEEQIAQMMKVFGSPKEEQQDKVRGKQGQPRGQERGKEAKQQGAFNTPGGESKGDFDKGPGLVDRVPSRPPDRRFEDRPNRPGTGGKRPANKGGRETIQQETNMAKEGQGGEQSNKPSQPVGTKQKERTTNTLRPQNTNHSPGQPSREGERRENPGQNQGQGQRNSKNRPPGGQSPHRKPQGGDRGPGTNGFGPRSDSRTPGGSSRPSGTKNGTPKVSSSPIKVPKVPEQANAQDKAKASEKLRNKVQQNQNRNAPPKNKDRFRNQNFGNDDRLPHKKKRPTRPVAKEPVVAPVVEKKPVVIGETATVQELAEKMKKSPAELIKKLMQLGVLATINQEVDIDTATILCEEFGYEVEVKIILDAEALIEQEQEDSPTDLVERPCVVTVMGHVDHGKTSLLDAIRQTNVIATEAGGITQHIGAYQIEHNNKKITFVDTPGHEAFTAMRARGAEITDIAILVVAADDGVMPQTIEAINHAKAADVPIIVAVNKIDKPGAEQDRVRQQLTEHGLVPEEWGGENIFVPVSAKTREGLNDLLEMILLVAEVGELKANPKRDARGTVIEAQLDKGRGPVATVLVQNGTLSLGDSIVAGAAFGKVRAMMDDKGRRIKKAGPSTPVEVLGFHDVPLAGDLFYGLSDEKTARQIAEKRENRKRQEEMKQTTRVTLEDLFKHIQEGQVKELLLIVKADVQGSVEAVKQSLERLSTDEVKLNIIHGGVGAITETDIMLASASNAIIIGFNVRPDVNARKVAEAEKVDIRLYRVIYDAIEDVKAAMSGLLEPEIKEVILGRVEVRKIFKASKLGLIAGCYVVEGKITRDCGVRLIRDGVVIFEGKLDSLKRFKDDAKEVLQGFECGVTLEKYGDIHEGDVIETYTTEAIKRELA